MYAKRDQWSKKHVSFPGVVTDNNLT